MWRLKVNTTVQVISQQRSHAACIYVPTSRSSDVGVQYTRDYQTMTSVNARTCNTYLTAMHERAFQRRTYRPNVTFLVKIRFLLLILYDRKIISDIQCTY